MKITLLSDLHLEHDIGFSPTNPGSDVLILAGDIFVADYFTRSIHSPHFERARQAKEFFRMCSEEWERVIYIPGNHEYYHGYIDTGDDILREHVGQYATFLNNESVEIDGVAFFGSTLWTDVGNGNPISEMTLASGMNDFSIIQWNNTKRKFSPYEARLLHEDALERMREQLFSVMAKKVIVGHHAPSYQSVHDKYRPDVYMNHGYYSDLESTINEIDPVLWVHGHMHDSFDYTIGNTRVVCNPKGYHNENKNFNPALILKI